jgi:hypothetical protein
MNKPDYYSLIVLFPDLIGLAVWTLMAAVWLLMAWPLYRFQHKLAATTPRDWSEIRWPYRLGRLLLIAMFLGVLSVPVLWFLLR